MIGWRFATILGFAVLFALALLLMAITRRSSGRNSGRIATFGEVITQLGGSRGLRAVFIFVWAWVGWHFLAR